MDSRRLFDEAYWLIVCNPNLDRFRGLLNDYGFAYISRS